MKENDALMKPESPPAGNGTKLYLSADIRMRLRMLAYERGTTLTAVANEAFDECLPKWTVERSE